MSAENDYAECGTFGFPALEEPLAILVDSLAHGARVLAWAEGIHLRAEYLQVRNAVLHRLVATGVVGVIAAETDLELSRAADSYIRGEGPDDPSPEAVHSVWSWARAALLDNRNLLTWLRTHNAGRAPADQVRFRGLETHTGDHRDLALRDAAQYESLVEVAGRHPERSIFVFEQTEHLDRRLAGSLGSHLARGELGTVRTVGAVWRAGDPTVRYPLGPYAALSHWLDDNRGELLDAPAGTGVRDLRSDADHPALADAATAFDAVLYAPRLSAAEVI